MDMTFYLENCKTWDGTKKIVDYKEWNNKKKSLAFKVKEKKESDIDEEMLLIVKNFKRFLKCEIY